MEELCISGKAVGNLGVFAFLLSQTNRHLDAKKGEIETDQMMSKHIGKHEEYFGTLSGFGTSILGWSVEGKTSMQTLFNLNC